MKLNVETFEALLNKKFTATFDAENTYELELVEITKHKPIPSLKLEPFTLTFKGGRDEKIFSQSTYKLSEDSIGEHDLFFIPRQPDEEGIYYEIIVQ